MKPTSPAANLISPEKVQPNVWHTLTISPHDDYQGWTSNEVERIGISTSFADTMLAMLAENAKAELYIEASRTGRLHFHGRIKFKSHKHIRNFYLITLYRMLKGCTMEIDTIDDEAGWLIYCTKSIFLFPEVPSPLTSDDAVKKLNKNNKKFYKKMTDFVDLVPDKQPDE